MATINVTSTAAQDAAVIRRTDDHNLQTGGSETPVQYARRHFLALLDSWVADDGATSLASAKDRWLRSNDTQRTAALNQLEP